ncbi:MAG: PilN domain-containing protein [Acidimicrobiia bacterium]
MRAINLLPPEAAQRSRGRRRVALVVMAGIAYLALLGLASVWYQGKAADLEAAAQAQQARNAELQAQIGQLSAMAELRAGYEQGITRMQDILARDIAWGPLLADMGRRLPDRTWLTSFSGQALFNEDQPERYGQLSMAGTAFDYPDTASWLRVLDSEAWPAVGGAWLPAAQESTIGEVEVVDFQSVAALTDASRSNRLDRLPEVPE